MRSDDDEILSIFNQSFNYDELCAAFICLHYSANFTKTQLAKVCEFSSLITPAKTPKSFNECVNTLLTKFGKEKQIMNKNWFCSKCKEFDVLKKTNDRECSICQNTLANYIYLPLENQLLQLINKFPDVSSVFIRLFTKFQINKSS
jgi:hypothetical protein